jgi:hypothetical protein
MILFGLMFAVGAAILLRWSVLVPIVFFAAGGLF